MKKSRNKPIFLSSLSKLLIPFLACFCCASAQLSGSENAVIVINAESSSSKLIANHYIALRNIPDSNVIYLSDIPQKEVITMEQFRSKILKPIATTITQRRLNTHVDYIIYSAGFPTVVNAKDEIKKLRLAKDATARLRGSNKMFAPAMSINSATYFLENVLSKDYSFLSLNANNYCRKKLETLLNTPFVSKDQVNFRQAISYARRERFEQAVEALTELADKHPLQMAVLYWLARTYAWSGEAKKANDWLNRAVAVGWCYRDYTARDTAFARMKDDAKFQAILAFMDNLPARYGPTLSFRNTYNWGPNGNINSTPDQGHRYVLSTVLGVTRNEGNSEKECLQYLTESVGADGTKPQGTFYFTKTKDVRTKTRYVGIDEAIEELECMGYRSEIIRTKMVSNRTDIIGLTMGTPTFEWSPSISVKPGAICENLTSFGGRLSPGKKQTKLTSFLRHGAAGSSGTVVEPYAIQAKFPHPKVHTHYVKGCTLAESFYQSVAGPFQLLIVGDPLCRPWADIPDVRASGDLPSKSELSGKINFRVEASQSGKPVRLIEMYLDGRLVRKIGGSKTGTIEIDTATMPDGFHELRFVGIANGPIQTRGSKVLPFSVNNNNQTVKIEVSSKVPDINQKIAVGVSAPDADEIRLMHNGRIIGKVESDVANFQVAAFTLGRGPVKIEAIALYENLVVRGEPVNLNVSGSISTTIPILRSPTKNPKSKKTNDKKSPTKPK